MNYDYTRFDNVKRVAKYPLPNELAAAMAISDFYHLYGTYPPYDSEHRDNYFDILHQFAEPRQRRNKREGLETTIIERYNQRQNELQISVELDVNLSEVFQVLQIYKKKQVFTMLQDGKSVAEINDTLRLAPYEINTLIP